MFASPHWCCSWTQPIASHLGMVLLSISMLWLRWTACPTMSASYAFFGDWAIFVGEWWTHYHSGGLSWCFAARLAPENSHEESVNWNCDAQNGLNQLLDVLTMIDPPERGCRFPIVSDQSGDRRQSFDRQSFLPIKKWNPVKEPYLFP